MHEPSDRSEVEIRIEPSGKSAAMGLYVNGACRASLLGENGYALFGTVQELRRQVARLAEALDATVVDEHRILERPDGRVPTYEELFRESLEG